MYIITLNNGVRLENLVLNGNNFISETVIEDSVFDGNLGTVIISDGEESKTYNDMALLSNRVDGGKTWFVLGEKSDRQKKDEKTSRELAEMRQAMAVLLTGEV